MLEQMRKCQWQSRSLYGHQEEALALFEEIADERSGADPDVRMIAQFYRAEMDKRGLGVTRNEEM